MAWYFKPTAGDINEQYSGKLGTNTIANAGDYNDNDIGKPVKYGANDTFVLCAATDVPDGFIAMISDYPQDGYRFGAVQLEGRVKVTVVGATVAVKDLMVAATPTAAKTAETKGYGLMQKRAAGTTTGTTAADAIAIGIEAHAAAVETKHWQVISLLGGNGAADTKVIIEEC